MTVEQMLDQLEITLPLDLYKSRSNMLKLMNLVNKDIIEDGQLLNETLDKTLSTSANTIDLSGDNVRSISNVFALDANGTNWVKMTKSKYPVSVYRAETLDLWYWDYIGTDLTFNKTATVNISVKVDIVKSATALTDGSGSAEVNIDKYLIDGTIKLLRNAEEYHSWLWNEAIPQIRENVFGVQSFERIKNFF